MINPNLYGPETSHTTNKIGYCNFRLYAWHYASMSKSFCSKTKFKLLSLLHLKGDRKQHKMQKVLLEYPTLHTQDRNVLNFIKANVLGMECWSVILVFYLEKAIRTWERWNKKKSDDQSMLDTLCNDDNNDSISTIIKLINITMENNRNSQNQDEKELISSKRSRLIIRSNWSGHNKTLVSVSTIYGSCSTYLSN